MSSRFRSGREHSPLGSQSEPAHLRPESSIVRLDICPAKGARRPCILFQAKPALGKASTALLGGNSAATSVAQVAQLAGSGVQDLLALYLPYSPGMPLADESTITSRQRPSRGGHTEFPSKSNRHTSLNRPVDAGPRLQVGGRAADRLCHTKGHGPTCRIASCVWARISCPSRCTKDLCPLLPLNYSSRYLSASTLSEAWALTKQTRKDCCFTALQDHACLLPWWFCISCCCCGCHPSEL